MKQETITKGADILNKIDHAQRAMACVITAKRIEFDNGSGTTLARIHPDQAQQGVDFKGHLLPEEVNQQLRSEALRFISRCKRHLENYEFSLKQELEDLQDEK